MSANSGLHKKSSRGEAEMCGKQPLVSIIMPVYNAEKYLSEAIESVLRQTCPDFELLLVNDHSSDHSGQICAEYAKKDPRIVLLENASELHGPGPTRNIGLDHAAGEYLYFMDADDWIDERLLECAVDCMRENDADIVQFGVLYERNDGARPMEYCWGGRRVLTKADIQEDISSFLRKNRNSLWLHLFRAETVKSIQFENIVIGEDGCYVVDGMRSAARIAYLPEILYHYRCVDGSTSHSWIPNTVECREKVWAHKKGFLDSFAGRIERQVYAEAAYDNCIWMIYLLCSKVCPLTYKEKRRQLRILEEKMEFDQYRGIYPLNRQTGLQKLKYALVKYRLEKLMLLAGPLFLKIVRGENVGSRKTK